MREVVAALGNAWRGDDGLGPRVLELLGHGCQLGDDLTELLSLFEARPQEVILVDAIRAELAPGTILAWHPEEAQAGAARLSSHGLDLQQVLQLARALGCLPRTLTVVGVVGRDFSVGAPLSPEVEVAAHLVAAMCNDADHIAWEGSGRRLQL